MEREGNEYFSLSFHILFFPFFLLGKNGKTHIFPWEKMGLDPPPKGDMSGIRRGRRQGWEREKMGRETGVGEREMGIGERERERRGWERERELDKERVGERRGMGEREREKR